MKIMKRLLSLFLTFLLSFSLLACSDIDKTFEGLGLKDETKADDTSVRQNDIEENSSIESTDSIDEDGNYTSKEDVSLYIHTFDKLPSNYITKKQATELGWESSKGNLWEVTDQKSIGGDRFGNREKKLPTAQKREYRECDINFKGGYRGSERIVYSNDGLIYYTEDHYNSFTLLYGDE